jgi:hypothetical protein
VWVAVFVELIEGGNRLIHSLNQLGTQCLDTSCNHYSSSSVVDSQFIVERTRAFLR